VSESRVRITRTPADLQDNGAGAGHTQARIGNLNAAVHGAKSPRLIAPKARAIERAFLRRNGLKAGQLDPISREVLRMYARGLAVLELREAGGADEARDYWTAFNATRRCLERLEVRLRDLGLDRAAGRDLESALRALREGRE
jgi:hypothetical protein